MAQQTEFIPHEQALALKELGFDDKCLGYYNIDPSLKHVPFNPMPPFEHEWCLPAPLYQQAFRWFREKYGLHYIIQGLGGGNTYDVGINRGVLMKIAVSYTPYTTYEEAELACLKKLIEIVKNK